MGTSAEENKVAGWGIIQEKSGAVERTRTSTVLLPPAPQAGASASSATTALWETETILAAEGRPRNRKWADRPKNYGCQNAALVQSLNLPALRGFCRRVRQKPDF